MIAWSAFAGILWHGPGPVSPTAVHKVDPFEWVLYCPVQPPLFILTVHSPFLG